MLITTAFSSTKAGPPGRPAGSGSKEDVLSLQRPSSPEESTSTSAAAATASESHADARKHLVDASKRSSTLLSPLTTSQATTLNLFLRSSRSIAALQIADIQRVIDPATGEHRAPAVRKGRIRTGSRTNGPSQSDIQCCIVESLPFEKCEIVATIVKKNAIYRQARQGYTSTSSAMGGDHKGKGRLEEDPVEEQVQLIFYELDDDSGASMTCCVNPSKVYARELSECRNRQASSSSVRSCTSGSEEESHSDADLRNDIAEGVEVDQSTLRSSRDISRAIDRVHINEDQRKSDPRLWIYRYKSPPRPAPVRLHPYSGPSFNVPIYKEGCIVRIIGKIFTNPARGNERQLEASSIECLYEPGYIIGRRVHTDKGNKYAEWHHTVKCRKKRLEYGDRDKVRELIGFADKIDNSKVEQWMSCSISQDVTMQDDTKAFSNDASDTTISSASHMSSTSLLDKSRLPDASSIQRTIGKSSISASASSKPKKAKLPSCSTLYKQKIAITKEIFSLYVHQFFRDIEKNKNGKRGRILPSFSSSSSTRISGSLGVHQPETQGTNIKVTLDEIKEDKNLKWLAEIYARNEARAMAVTSQQQGTLDSVDTPKSKRRYMVTGHAESSIIHPASSPAYSSCATSLSRGKAVIVDTTNISSISSSPSSISKNGTSKKVKVAAAMVDKLRNDLFRNTILKLVKDGIIVVYPAELPLPEKRKTTSKRARECTTCSKRLHLELQKIPPIMTMEGIPLRESRAKQMQEEDCQCTSSARIEEETYALLSFDMLMPVVEKIVCRMDQRSDIEVESVWNAIRRQDDMWRFVSKATVKECLEMV